MNIVTYEYSYMCIIAMDKGLNTYIYKTYLKCRQYNNE